MTIQEINFLQAFANVIVAAVCAGGAAGFLRLIMSRPEGR